MRRLRYISGAVLSIGALLLFTGPGRAATPGPSASLVLAAIVARHAPLLGHAEKAEIARLANGNLGTGGTRRLAVQASQVKCRISDVDITARRCVVRFDRRAVTLTGLRANELYATLLEAGVQPGGAAGSIYADISDLRCVIDPAELRQRAGGGASCSFRSGPG